MTVSELTHHDIMQVVRNSTCATSKGRRRRKQRRGVFGNTLDIVKKRVAAKLNTQKLEGDMLAGFEAHVSMMIDVLIGRGKLLFTGSRLIASKNRKLVGKKRRGPLSVVEAPSQEPDDKHPHWEHELPVSTLKAWQEELDALAIQAKPCASCVSNHPSTSSVLSVVG